MRRPDTLARLSIGPLLIGACRGPIPRRAGTARGPLRPRPSRRRPMAQRRLDGDTNAGHYVELQLRTAKDRYYRGEPIVVECRLVNRSKTLDAHYFCMYGRYCNPRESDFVFHIGVTRKGAPVGTTRFGSHLGSFSGSHRPFPHGNRDTRRVTINTIFDMTEDGEYRLAATIPVQGPGDDGRGWHGWLVKIRGDQGGRRTGNAPDGEQVPPPHGEWKPPAGGVE